LKVKLLRRVFCVVMCVVILACSSVNAFCVEIYSSIYKLQWNDNGWNTLRIQWYDYNCASANSPIASKLDAGTNFWSSESFVSDVEVPLNTAGSIAHAVPERDWWEEYWDNNFAAALEAAGVTFIFDTNYNMITTDNVAYSTGLIEEAVIYYNPTGVLSVYQGSLECLVAHEIGHALGFGHHTSNPSIMRQGLKNYTGLQPVDITDLYDKYYDSAQ